MQTKDEDVLDNVDKVFYTFVIIFIVIPFSILSGLYGAWLFTDCWKWFIVPLGVPAINTLTAWGIIVMTLFFKPVKSAIDNDKPFKKQFRELVSLVVASYFLYTYTWVFCLIIHSWNK